MQDVNVRFVSRDDGENRITWVASIERAGQSLPDPRVVRMAVGDWDSVLLRAGGEDQALAEIASEVVASVGRAPCQVVIEIGRFETPVPAFAGEGDER